VRNAHVRQQRVDVRVAAEERVQPRLEPVAVAVAPRRELAAGNVALLDDERGLAGIGKVLGGGESGRPRADDEDVRIGDGDQRTNSCGWATVG